MTSDHHHHHSPPCESRGLNRAFGLGVVLNLGFVAIEAYYGYTADSLALLADAGHNLSDVLGLVLAWAAMGLCQVKPTGNRTYGWRSFSIMAAMFNAFLLIAAVGGIGWEAFGRLKNPPQVAGATMILVALAGVGINTATAFLFMKGQKEDLNVKGAFLHMAADAAVSAGVVAAGVLIWFTGKTWIDPVVSLGVALVILWGTWSLLTDSMNLALHGVPRGIDTEAVRDYLMSLSGVTGVHDLHIWALSTTENALTAHLIKPEESNDDALLMKASRELRQRFGIHHATLQVERGLGGDPCKNNPYCHFGKPSQ